MGEPQSGCLTLLELRRALQSELSEQALTVQRAVHEDTQKMILELQGTLLANCPNFVGRGMKDSSSTLRSAGAQGENSAVPALPTRLVTTPAFLPGLVTGVEITTLEAHDAASTQTVVSSGLAVAKDGSGRSGSKSSWQKSDPDTQAAAEPERQVSADLQAAAKFSSRVLITAKGQDKTTLVRTKTASLQRRVLGMCNHVYFDYVTAALILLNGIMVGVQTDYMAREDMEHAPMGFEVLEMVFCVLFTSELGLRLFAHRLRFFTMSAGRGWNIFDFTIVSLQLLEIFLNLLASGLGFNFNVLRILRLMRIVRLARTLRLIGELRTIVSSIAGSLKPLFWTAVLLFMMIYVLGICFTQTVHTKKIELLKDSQDVPFELTEYWGSLMASIFSLFESISGGVDWDDVCRPLIEHIGPEVGILFCGYILFTVLAMLNVVTGVFIDSVMTNALHEKEARTVAHVENLFKKLDIDQCGEITWEAFERQLDQKAMKDFFKTIDVDISKARSLFELLDLDDSGSVDVGEFMDGCLRIWSPAKGLDLRMILRDVHRVGNMLGQVNTASMVSGPVQCVSSDDDSVSPISAERQFQVPVWISQSSHKSGNCPVSPTSPERQFQVPVWNSQNSGEPLSPTSPGAAKRAQSLADRPSRGNW